MMCLTSPRTRAYGVFDNAKLGTQGSWAMDGVLHGWDLNPGSPWPEPTDSSAKILVSYLAQQAGMSAAAVAEAMLWTGVRPHDDAFVRPRRWYRLPVEVDWFTDDVQSAPWDPIPFSDSGTPR